MTTLVQRFERFKCTRQLLFTTYLAIISGGGFLLIVQSLGQIPFDGIPTTFLLLVTFAAFSAIVTTSMPLKSDSGITYHIGSAVSIAAVPIFGAGGAVLIATTQGVVGWLAKPTDDKTWKKTWRQLAFNLGMDAIAIFVASHLLLFIRKGLGVDTFWGESIPWLIVAMIYTEVNQWLLIGVLRLQHGPTFNIWEMWRTDRWSAQIDILLMAVGGGLLAFAMQHYDWLGVIIFFLPIALSAYAFRLYIRQMQAHLNNLDQIIHDRTASLQVEILERQRVEAELRRLATIDPLTNALNRRSFFAGAQAEFTAAQSAAMPIATLMFDLDRFKQINDRYGHAAGDAALKYFAELARTMVSESQLFGRLGGEEFAFCLPNADLATATAIGGRICTHCPLITITAGEITFTVSVSVGVACWTEADQTLDQLLERADQHLYLAKRRGGNCVVNTADPVSQAS